MAIAARNNGLRTCLPAWAELGSADGRMLLKTRVHPAGGLPYRVRQDGTDVFGWSSVGLRLKD